MSFPGGGTREAWSNLDKFRSKEAESRLSSSKTETPQIFCIG